MTLEQRRNAIAGKLFLKTENSSLVRQGPLPSNGVAEKQTILVFLTTTFIACNRSYKVPHGVVHSPVYHTRRDGLQGRDAATPNVFQACREVNIKVGVLKVAVPDVSAV